MLCSFGAISLYILICLLLPPQLLGLAPLADQSINQSIQAVDIYFQHSPTTGAELSMLVDAGWRLHLRFYAAIGAFLAPGGRIIFQENAGGSRPEDFLRMVIDVRLPFCQSIQDLTFWD